MAVLYTTQSLENNIRNIQLSLAKKEVCNCSLYQGKSLFKYRNFVILMLFRFLYLTHQYLSTSKEDYIETKADFHKTVNLQS